MEDWSWNYGWKCGGIEEAVSVSSSRFALLWLYFVGEHGSSARLVMIKFVTRFHARLLSWVNTHTHWGTRIQIPIEYRVYSDQSAQEESSARGGGGAKRESDAFS